MTLALEGIRVLDLSRLAPGPYCTMFLADHGADVLRIEEFTKLSGRRAEQSKGAAVVADGASGLPEHVGFVLPRSPFNALNRNKRSLALNLKAEEGREIFYKLAKKSDVVVEEFRPGVTRRLGIDYDTLRALNPGLVYCAITSYGQKSPYRDYIGHDINFASMGGALSIMGRQGEPPMIPSNILADYAGGLQAAFGILAAVVARSRTAEGQFVDIALVDSVTSLLAHMLSWSFATGIVPDRGSHVTTGLYPFYNVYETRDNKYISIGCMEPWLYANLCRALGLEELIPFQYVEDSKKRDEVFAAFRQVFLTRTRDDWFDYLIEKEVPVGKVYAFDELASDRHIREREMIVELPDSTAGKIQQVGIPVKLSETPGRIQSLAPGLGSHTKEVLLELGYTETQILALDRTGVVRLSTA